MKVSNNLNQLLSRVKTIFGRKATPATNAATSAEPPTDLSVVSGPRLNAALADIEKYLADNFGTPTVKLQYKDYANGTNLTSKDATFAVSLVILTTPDGAAHLPDNVLLLGGVSSTNDVKWLAAELRKFTNFLMQLCPKHRIQHLAFAFDKTESDAPTSSKMPMSPASASTKRQPHPTPQQDSPSCRGVFINLCSILFCIFKYIWTIVAPQISYQPSEESK